MKQTPLHRPGSRVVCAILAVWMTLFTFAEAVHTHDRFAKKPTQTALSQPTVGDPQRDFCPACLASHNQAPAVDVSVVFSFRPDAQGITPVDREGALLGIFLPTVASRAPPASSTTQA
jgi:hypothetical protein